MARAPVRARSAHGLKLELLAEVHLQVIGFTNTRAACRAPLTSTPVKPLFS